MIVDKIALHLLAQLAATLALVTRKVDPLAALPTLDHVVPGDGVAREALGAVLLLPEQRAAGAAEHDRAAGRVVLELHVYPTRGERVDRARGGRRCLGAAGDALFAPGAVPRALGYLGQLHARQVKAPVAVVAEDHLTRPGAVLDDVVLVLLVAFGAPLAVGARPVVRPEHETTSSYRGHNQAFSRRAITEAR